MFNRKKRKEKIKSIDDFFIKNNINNFKYIEKKCVNVDALKNANIIEDIQVNGSDYISFDNKGLFIESCDIKFYSKDKILLYAGRLTKITFDFSGRKDFAYLPLFLKHKENSNQQNQFVKKFLDTKPQKNLIKIGNEIFIFDLVLSLNIFYSTEKNLSVILDNLNFIKDYQRIRE